MTVRDLRIVLVRPIYSKNVGATSRAIGNMGGKQLYLVDKACKLDGESRQWAAGGRHALEHCLEFDSLPQLHANSPHGCYIGMTRRTGQHRQPRALEEVLERVGEMDVPAGPLYLVFGPEDCGLTHQDLQHVHHCAFLPTYGEMDVLNLSQAVLLTLYICQRACHVQPPNQYVEPTEPASGFPHGLFVRWLEAVGYDLSCEVNAATKLNQMLRRAVPTPQECELLHDVLHQNIRKLT